MTRHDRPTVPGRGGAARPPARLAAGAFYGVNLGAAVEVAGLGLSLNGYPPGYRTPPHAHADALLYLVVDGTCRDSCGRRDRTVGPAALVFLPAGEPHATHWPRPGGRCFHVEFRPEWVARVRPHAAVLDAPAEFRGGAPVRLALRLLREFGRPDALSPLVIEGLTLELVAEAARRGAARGPAAPPRWLGRARELIDARFAGPLTLAEVAAAAGVHPVHLAAVFRRHHGCTVGEYVRRRRVEFAAGRLRATSTPLAEVALAAGFADQAHFCRTFKRLTGQTPGEYRRSRPRPA